MKKTMSRRSIKNCNSYREDPFKIENEPEEGEIVDEYDLIVSSDEELCMRQRIRQLEAENEEIEQIAVISRSYVEKISHPHNHLNSSRAAQVPTDASSISSTEFVTPKKRKRRKSREHKRKHCHRQHQHEHNQQYAQHVRHAPQQIYLKARVKRSHCKRRQKLFAKKHKQVHSDRFINKELDAETLSLESLESSESSSLTDVDNYSNNRLAFKRKETFNNEKYVTRDTLRLAVARNTDDSGIPLKKSCLKDKLLQQDLGYSSNMARSKRQNDVERDCIHYYNNDEDDDDVQVIEDVQYVQTIDEDSTNSMEEKELRLIALKSAVLKKHMARKMRNAEVAYSPTDFDDMLSSGILRHDNKLNDIDVVDLEAYDSQTAFVTVSPEASPQLMMLDDQDDSQQMVDCKPIDMDIANSDSEDATIDIWSKEVKPSLPKLLESQDYANNIQYGFYTEDLEEVPPPPPGVDDYENMPPPPPYNVECQDMDLDNEELADDEHRVRGNAIDILADKRTDHDKAEEEFEDKEEEEALRALLLSKFQSPKNQRKIKKLNEVNESGDTFSKTDVTEQTNSKQKPTEIILKEAVKRLKIHSQIEFCKEETQEYFENCDPLNPLQKIRDRLNKSKIQIQSVDTNSVKEDTSKSLLEQKEVDQTAAYLNNNTLNEYNTNSLEATSTVDILDITRRLQKIKENVLNSNYNLTPRDPPPINSEPQVVDIDKSLSECFPVAENVLESNPPPSSLENICEPNKPLTNNAATIFSENNELNSELTRKKVKADFDATLSQTIFKVTITNNAALKLEDSDITSSHYQNRNNTESKSFKLRMNGNIKSKVGLSSERLLKITDKTRESCGESYVQLTKAISVAKPTVNAIKVTPTPTKPLLGTTKIVKPNKVINTNFDLNSKQIAQANEPTSISKPSKPESSTQLSKATDNTRLITSIEQVKHMCAIAPIVINVQNSSNESSDGECNRDYNLLYKPLYDYNDNASPLSLNLESPTLTPIRSNSPTEACVDRNNKQADSETFVLKTKKTFVNREHLNNKTSQIKSSVQAEKTNKTPLAVRHLPAEAQKEYRRLVHRMKLLENKRKYTDTEERENDCTTYKTNSATVDPKEKDKADSINTELKTSLVKKVLLRNANNKPTLEVIAPNETQILNGSSSNPSKLNKSNVLQSYESLYMKFGAGIVNNLDKSLKLVEEAKKAKIAKLKLENRLKELKAEMDILQTKHKEEQQKITRIYPSVCATNEVITSLKQKRTKVFKAALNLGKTLKGEVYRLNNDLKENINIKSKKLATEIKIVNSLKAQDIKNIEDTINTNTTQQQTDNEKNNVADFTPKSNEDDIEMKRTSNNATEIKTDCSESVKLGKEKSNPESPLKIEDGGNKEFQSSESNNDTETSHPDKDTVLKIADSEVNSKQISSLSSYISPLEHLRNIDSNVDPNGVICPYDLMGNCEDVNCKYVHIAAKTNT